MWKAIRDWVMAFLSALGAFYAGTIKRENEQYEEDLGAIEAAAKAAVRFDSLPMLTSCASSKSGSCIVYLQNRPTVSRADTMETQRRILKLDVAMEAACSK